MEKVFRYLLTQIPLPLAIVYLLIYDGNILTKGRYEVNIWLIERT